MTKIDVLRIDRAGKKKLKDIVTKELHLTVYLEGKQLIRLLCSPDNLQELSVGFLYSSGLIKSIKDIKDISINKKNQRAEIKLNPQDLVFRPKSKRITADVRVTSQKVSALMDALQKKSVTFRETGAVHSAALSDGNDILIFQEDIGRYNALDKVIGQALEQDINMEGLIVLISGRITSEIISKVKMTKATLVISRSAPTEQAVNLAKKLNLTLIGFARGKRMNVYTASERVR